MSFDDLYTISRLLNKSTNEVNTAYGVITANTHVSPASTQVSTASTQVSTANLCDDTVYAFLASQPNRGPRNQDNRNMNQDSSRRTINVEEISSKTMLTIDGASFGWSYMADDEVPTNMALMDFLESEIENLVDKKVKIIRCDKGTEFKNRVMSEFCEKKGIKKEFSVARTPPAKYMVLQREEIGHLIVDPKR
ncbi:ribonuclease H-like domain-containing protein [Tanacetum coccineum]